MPEFIVEPTAEAQWQSLVREAAEAATQPLDESLESYLVFLLNRSTRDAQTLAKIMAVEYLQAMHTTGRQGEGRLREVGDHCLLLAGLFPQRAQRRRVRIGYFVDLGRSAYHQLAERVNQSTAQLYQELSTAFVSLMDVLLAMRELSGPPALTPLEAVDLWQDARSRHALRVLRRNTSGHIGPHTDRRRH